MTDDNFTTVDSIAERSSGVACKCGRVSRRGVWFKFARLPDVERAQGIFWIRLRKYEWFSGAPPGEGMHGL